jgi:hypothetical protein
MITCGHNPFLAACLASKVSLVTDDEQTCGSFGVSFQGLEQFVSREACCKAVGSRSAATSVNL